MNSGIKGLDDQQLERRKHARPTDVELDTLVPHALTDEERSEFDAKLAK